MTAKQYRKRPVVIEAIQLQEPYSAVEEFCPEILFICDGDHVAYALIRTLEGNMTADLGDWIIRGVQGEYYPCTPNIFNATYEPVKD